MPAYITDFMHQVLVYSMTIKLSHFRIHQRANIHLIDLIRP